MRSGTIQLALAIGCLAGCGDSEVRDAGIDAADAGAPRDASTSADAGSEPDASGADDAGAPIDPTVCDSTLPAPNASPVAERVASIGYVGGVAITVDCTGTPLVAHAGRGVHFARRTGDDAWDTTLVADDQFADHVDVDVTPGNVVHLTIARVNTDGVVHHRGEGGAWTNEDIDPLGRARYLRQSLDADQTPHVAYIGDTDDAAVYAVRAATGWRTSPAFSTERADFSALSFEPDGTVHMVVQTFVSERLLDLRLDAGVWTPFEVDNAGRTMETNTLGGYASSRIDEAGVGHFVYRADDGRFSPMFHELRYARREGDTVTYETVAPDTSVVGRSDLAVGPDEVLRVVFLSTNRSGLTYSARYAERVGGSWMARTLDDDVGRESGISLAVDQFGTAHVAWADAFGVQYARIPDATP